MAYTSIELEGGLFPPDLLDQVAAAEADGQRPEDFGLGRGARLSDEIQAAFSDVRTYWEAFQRRLLRTKEAPTTVTREAWVGPLLERLGFEPKYQGSVAAGGDTYAISHRLLPADDAPPINIVAAGQDLDRRSEGSRRSPHAAMQEYLNRSDHVWGLLTNGEQLRLVRDSARLSRPTYLEVDLRALVEANLYSEFVLIYRLLHRSRWPASSADTPSSYLEAYYQFGIDEGSRVREHLREGVEEALRQLGTAFVGHPANERLRARLSQGSLTHDAFYRQLLRLVYRTLFLMVIEERRLVFPPGTERSETRAAYSRYYSLTSLRHRAEIAHYGDAHGDLWQGLLRTFELFRDEAKAAQLGLAPMNGELFSPEACEDLETAECANAPLLDAVVHLSTFVPESGAGRRRVNYAGLDVEELGSVYEGLLEYQPRVMLDGPARFDLVVGSERRQTGSYYTPPELVKELVDAALVPVITERLGPNKAASEDALLSLRICDLASGSGHFLLEAARRLARELARARSHEDEPTPAVFRAALRDVIRTCIYAVDKNPLAVDLCKVALWIEGHSAGLPLSFLDHHVKHGDSLVGIGPDVDIEAGIPSDAYHRAEPARRARARLFRQQNDAERSTGQLTLVTGGRVDLTDLAESFRGIAGLPDDSIASVAEKGRRYLAARARGGSWWLEETASHLWAAPFFVDLGQDSVPTTGALRAFRADPDAFGHDGMVRKAWALAEAPEHPFFHWPLEFPEVISRGGFDVVLSNPPFMGGLRIRGNFSDEYRNYLATVFTPFAGRTDLSAAFIRRGFALLRPGGRVGMVVTKTIGEGDTRAAGLSSVLANGGAITFARRFIKWPGTANVEVNLVAIARASSPATRTLDGQAAPYISSRLDEDEEQQPVVIEANRGKGFQGSNIVGMGFTITPDKARDLIERNARNAECLYPFLNGEDLNSSVSQSASRWVIQFDERSEAEARSYPDLWRIVEERVRPERARLNPKMYRRAVSAWWKHVVNPQELYRTVRPLGRALVRAATSEYHMLALVPANQVFQHTIYVFAFSDEYHFAVLQSSIHEAWVGKMASSLESRTRYSLSQCFTNFPLPERPGDSVRETATSVAASYLQRRAEILQARRFGLTKLHNLLNDERCVDSDVEETRRLRGELDHAVAACYGWSDLRLDSTFEKNERGRVRFTIAAEARRELVRRLLDLNSRLGNPPGPGD